MTYYVSGVSRTLKTLLTHTHSTHSHSRVSGLHTAASKRIRGDGKCVTEIIAHEGGGGQNKQVRKEENYLFVSRKNKRIRPMKQSTKCVDVYV